MPEVCSSSYHLSCICTSCNPGNQIDSSGGATVFASECLIRKCFDAIQHSFLKYSSFIIVSFNTMGSTCVPFQTFLRKYTVGGEPGLRRVWKCYFPWVLAAAVLLFVGAGSICSCSTLGQPNTTVILSLRKFSL
jgi:hypothetical protein